MNTKQTNAGEAELGANPNKVKAIRLSMVEYRENEAIHSKLGTVNLTLSALAALHPKAEFIICKSDDLGLNDDSMFGAFKFKNPLRPLLFVRRAVAL